MQTENPKNMSIRAVCEEISKTVYFPNCLNKIIANYARDEDDEHAHRLINTCLSSTFLDFNDDKLLAKFLYVVEGPHGFVDSEIPTSYISIQIYESKDTSEWAYLVALYSDLVQYIISGKWENPSDEIIWHNLLIQDLHKQFLLNVAG